MRVRAPGACGVRRVGSGRVIGRRRRGDDLCGRANRGRDASPDGLVVRPWRRRTMRRAPDLRGRAPSDVDPPEVQSQDARNAPTQHGREADLRPSGTLRRAAGSKSARGDHDRCNGGNREDSGHARHRSPIHPAGTDSRRAARVAIDVLVDRRRLERALDCRRMLAPEVLRARRRRVQAAWRVHAGWERAQAPRGRVRARWVRVRAGGCVRARRRCVPLARRRSRTERHQLLAGSEPVAREAYDLAPRLSLSLLCLGLPTFPQRVDALFQRFLRRRRQRRPSRAVL